MNEDSKKHNTPTDVNNVLANTSGNKWLNLNSHGKNCLRSFVLALSSSDLTNSQIDYLLGKGLIASGLKFKDAKERELTAGYCLTDLGIATVKHYIPRYYSK